MYLLYDKHTGPQPSEEQPNEEDLKLMGPVGVIRGGLHKRFEVYSEKDTKRVWARLVD